MFESVPSVEYKRLDETEKSQNDSLDDISVSLNDPKSRQGQVSGDKERSGGDNTDQLSFIDEEPATAPAQGDQSSSQSSGQFPPPGDSGDSGGLVCDDCVSAGHLGPGSEDITSQQPQQTVSDINQNIQKESLNNGPAQVREVSDANTNIETCPETQRAPPVTDGGDERDERDERERGGSEETNGLQLMASKLSVASIVSGESIGSFSFSADSLGIRRINDDYH